MTMAQKAQWESILQKDTVFLVASDVYKLLNVNPATIRWQAQQRPDLLGFETVCMKTRVYIPRIPFIAWYKRNAGINVSEVIAAKKAAERDADRQAFGVC